MAMEEQSINLECHSRKDEFHLLRVPKGFDIKQLDGVAYNPEEILEIETKKDKCGLVTVYELGTLSSEGMNLNVLVKSDDKIKVGPALQHNIAITKTARLDSQEIHFAVTSLQAAPSGNIDLPVGLRERFTPFGAKAPLSPSKSKKRSKKEKKRKRQSDDCPITPENDNSKEDDSISHSCSIGAFGDAGNVFEDTPVIDKRKKHKKKRKSSETEIHMNGYASPGIDKSPIENGLSVSVADDNGEPEVRRSHKKKKKRSSLDEGIEICGDDSMNQTLDESVVKKHKEKKKKKKDKD